MQLAKTFSITIFLIGLSPFFLISAVKAEKLPTRSTIIEQAYIFLCLNYEPGDEIYLFGFSRGAYTVRSLAGLIDRCGLSQRPNINRTAEAYRIYRLGTKGETKAISFRQKYKIEKLVSIKFLGCWDTVGALGIPNAISWLPIDKFFKRNLKFHDNQLSSTIENARHAIAIDEKRSAFEVTLMEPGDDFQGTLKQVWFPGDHGCVGGGTNETINLPDNCKLRTLDLSQIALEWMAEEVKQLGLDLNLAKANNQDLSEPNPKNVQVRSNLFANMRDLSKFDDLVNDFHESIAYLWCNKNYRPKNLQVINDKIEERCQKVFIE